MATPSRHAPVALTLSQRLRRDPQAFEWNLYTEGWSRGSAERYDSTTVNSMTAPWLGMSAFVTLALLLTTSALWLTWQSRKPAWLLLPVVLMLAARLERGSVRLWTGIAALTDLVLALILAVGLPALAAATLPVLPALILGHQ